MKKPLAVAGLIVTFAGMAQPQAAPTRFDVATIKPSPVNDDRFALRALPGGALSAAGVPLKMLIMQAYGVQAFQISGEPAWVNTARWDIEAKFDGFQGRLSQAQFGAILRELLADRFQLRIRHESKELPTYALVVAKNGSKLATHTGDAPAPGQAVRSGQGLFSVKKDGVAPLAAQLERQLGRTVIDQTGLTGEFDYTLEWTPEPGQGGPESIGLPPGAEAPEPFVAKGPSIFTALQEQLGLRLESQKGPIEIIVIERVEKPSEN